MKYLLFCLLLLYFTGCSDYDSKEAIRKSAMRFSFLAGWSGHPTCILTRQIDYNEIGAICQEVIFHDNWTQYKHFQCSTYDCDLIEWSAPLRDDKSGSFKPGI